MQNEMLPKIQAVSAGSWDMSDVLKLGGFTNLLINQIRDVKRLEAEAGVGAPLSFFDSIDMSTIAIGGIALVGLGIMSGVFFGRRQTTQV